MSDTMNTLVGLGVLAGAYKSNKSWDAMVTHAASTEDLQVGRLRRESGEALCNRKLDMVDLGAKQPLTDVTCPKCREILERLGK